jgi:integrase
LFDKGLFGDHQPATLQRIVWWTLSLNFGFRARDESRKLKWGDVELGFDQESGQEILVWKAEQGTKTRHGEEHQTAFYPTAQTRNNHRCPVNLYNVFASIALTTPKPQTLRFSSQLIITERQTRRFGTPKVHLGRVNSIGMLLMKAAGLSGKITNHSVRKTCISRLMDPDVPTNFVTQLSGHKNLKKSRRLQDGFGHTPTTNVKNPELLCR